MRRGAVADMAPLQRAFGIVPSGTVPRPPKLCPSWDRLMPGARARRLVLAVQQATPRMRHHRRPITEGPGTEAAPPRRFLVALQDCFDPERAGSFLRMPRRPEAWLRRCFPL